MLREIEKKINLEQALSASELLYLYNIDDISVLAKLAGCVRERKNANKVFYNKNFHLEPSNVCVHRCKFCSYRRDSQNQDGAWSMSIDEVENYCREKCNDGITEVHIVGSVHPSKDFKYYLDVIRAVRRNIPSIATIKAYSAVEIADMCNNEKISFKEGISRLKDAGLQAIPGGGAEIFSSKIRAQICSDKINANEYLAIHREAHKQGIRTNATMLFGHIESREDRIEHLIMLRDLQENTNGFDSFIPLKYRIANNSLASIVKEEVGIIEVLKTFAISRLALNNFAHIKSYWPMLGKDLCAHALLFGADDIDGTINDSTKIYSMAGAEDTSPTMDVSELTRIAASAGFVAVERDSFYNLI